jgi:hypothetical protein
MTGDQIRDYVVATLRLAIARAQETQVDPARWAERDTDAGTRDPFPPTRIEPDPDAERDRKIESGEWE